MQRSITYKNPLTPFFYVVIFFIYSALGGVYIFLPPLLSILYILFSRTLDKQYSLYFFLVVICLIIFEAKNSYVLFSTIIYFTILYKYIMPIISKNLSCLGCVNIILVFLSYIGFFLFYSILSSVFMLQEPSISYNVIYYIIIEFFIVSLLLG